MRIGQEDETKVKITFSSSFKFEEKYRSKLSNGKSKSSKM